MIFDFPEECFGFINRFFKLRFLLVNCDVKILHALQAHNFVADFFQAQHLENFFVFALFGSLKLYLDLVMNRRFQFVKEPVGIVCRFRIVDKTYSFVLQLQLVYIFIALFTAHYHIAHLLKLHVIVLITLKRIS